MAKNKSTGRKRMTELLEAAADTFDDHSDPFNTDWIVKHEVSLEECMTMSEQIATAVRNYARLDNQELALAMVRAMEREPGERASMVAAMTQAIAMSGTLAKLDGATNRVVEALAREG